MRKYMIILIVFIVSCQKETETKSLIVTNEINQSIYKRYDTSTFVEEVLIMYYDANNKRIKSELFPVPYSSVKNLNSYRVTSVTLDDAIEKVYVFVRFYYSGDNISLINYESKLLPVGYGINSYSITDNDLVK